MTNLRPTPLLLALAAALWLPGAAAGEPAARPRAVAAVQSQSLSLPARGLFRGDALSDDARRRLGELLNAASGVQVQAVLIVPTGPWTLSEASADERALTPARLQALRQFMVQRGLSTKSVFVESRIDPALKEARLVVEVIGRPASD